MTEKQTETTRARAVNRVFSRCRANASTFLASQRSETLRSVCLIFSIWLLLGDLGPGFLQAKPKTDKFEGTVVVVGPKAITVKSRDNIYMVRTFNYSAELEQKILRKKPETGKKVTVHYVRGSDLALKVD
jgi:hypothetical protein